VISGKRKSDRGMKVLTILCCLATGIVSTMAFVLAAAGEMP
jgi:hypothetical protein